MYNTKAFKILAFIALFLLIIFSWVIWKDARDRKLQNVSENSGLTDPFGSGAGKNDLPSTGKDPNGSSGGNNGTDVPVVTTPVPEVTITETAPALRQLADKPIAGFTFVTEERIIPESDSATPAAGLVEVYDFSGYRTINFGEKADEIVAIKTVLNRQTPSPGLTVNTDYDTDMKNAVVAFQNANALPGDAVIGPGTYKKLNTMQGIGAYTSAAKKPTTETVLMARYIDMASGLVSDRAVRKSEDRVQVTKTSIPRVAEAWFDATGKSILMRYVKDDVIQTYLARLTFPTIDPKLTQEEKDKLPKTADISGEFLPEGIETLSVSRDKKNFFYMIPSGNGVAGLTYNFATKAKKQIYETPLHEWLADWGSEARVSITTKAAAEVPGYAYVLDAKTGVFSRFIGKEKGLTTLMSPDGKKLLYSVAGSAGLKTFILDTGKGTSLPVSPTTLPEKCLWMSDSKSLYCFAPVKGMTGTLPDDWYQGSISFDDALWDVDVLTGNGNIVYDFATKSGARIDAVMPMLNAAGDYFLFKNKKDGTLWGFDLAK